MYNSSKEVVGVECGDRFQTSADCEIAVDSCKPEKKGYATARKCAAERFQAALEVECESRGCKKGEGECKLTGQSIQSVTYTSSRTPQGGCYLKCVISGTGKCDCVT